MSDHVINMAQVRRPLTFSDIIGQPFARGVGKQLGKGIISGQGYILSGPKGCGKTTLARVIARSLNCESREESNGDPCNECASCLMSLAGNHMNIREINSASNGGIAEIKAQLEDMSYGISHGYRVYILDEMHMLTRNAFSVLLKPMEEPPENVVFIGTTTNPESIPETILSRSPVVPILPLSDDELHTVVSNVVSQGMEEDPSLWGDVSDEDIDMAVLSGAGSARQAITAISGVVFHGVSSGGFQGDIGGIADAIRRGSAEDVLALSLRVLSEKTVDPVSVVTLVMNRLLDGDVSALVSRQVAELATIAVDAKVSSPPVVVAARIAGVVKDGGADWPDTGQVSSSSIPREKPSTPPEKSSGASPRKTTQKDHVAQEEKKKESPQKKEPTQQKEAPQKKEPTAPKAPTQHTLTVTSDTSIDDVCDHIISSTSAQELLSPRWRKILNDPKKSSVEITDDNIVIITVEYPDEKLREGIAELLSESEILST